MKKNLDQWDRIAGLIALDRKKALDEFHRLEFVPGHLAARQVRSLSGWKRIMSPVIIATAASLFLVLVSFWLLRGSRTSSQAAPAWSEILADSFFYSGYDRPAVESAAQASPAAASVLFTAWAEAGLERATVKAEPMDPQAPVEHGDPEAVRRKLRQVIRENTLERLLTQFHEIHNKEA